MEHPYQHIQDGIDNAFDGDTVYVYNGTYYENIVLKSGIVVQGENRNCTLIDGTSIGSVVTADHVTGTVVDGFSVVNGFGTYNGGGMYNYQSFLNVSNCIFKENEADFGGGMYNIYSLVSVTNCIFENNIRGGGMYTRGSTVNVDNCVFRDNEAYKGGGMNHRGPSAVTVTNSTFEYNAAYNGGGMWNYDSSLKLNNCVFRYNEGGDSGGGLYNSGSSPATVTNCIFENNSAAGGGGIHITWCEPLVTITNCKFWNNIAGYYGGGIKIGGYSQVTVTDCVIGNNEANTAGGMFNGYSTVLVSNCTFEENVADGDNYWEGGGGMYNTGASVTVANCILWDNTAYNNNGGGMYNWDYSSVNVTNCVIWNNYADYSGDGMYNVDSSVNVTNCVIWDNDIYNSGCSPVVTYCDVQYGYPGEGNIGVYPLFMEPNNGDFHLQETSPCIDMGNNAAPDLPVTDFDGESRIIDGDADGDAIVDIGVDEYRPNVPPSLTALPGDIFVNLHWDLCEEGVLKYTLYRSESPDIGFESIVEVDNTVSFYQDAERFMDTTYYYAITTTDSQGIESEFSDVVSATPRQPTRGDVNNNGVIDLGDVIFLVNYLFRTSLEPPIMVAADINNDGTPEDPIVDLGDVVYLVNYLFKGGDPPSSLDWPNYPPNAHAEVDQTTAVGITVYFDATGSYDLDGTIISYEWDFGDNTTGTGIIMTHQYNNEGNYTVTLTVLDNENATNNHTRILQVFTSLHVPEDYTTIQDAINNATEGQGILVAPGTYPENIDFLGKAVKIKSTDGPEVTIIDGGQNDRVVLFNNEETENSCLDGFTITNGSTSWDGGGIFCGENTAPTITNNIITDNFAGNDGGGIYCYRDSSPTIQNNVIIHNTAADGGGIACYLSSPDIINNIITDNVAKTNYNGGGVYCKKASPTITNNIISNNTANSGGGIYCDHSAPTVMNTIIIGNTATNSGGGIGSYWASSPVITYCNVWDNSPNNYDGCSPGTGCIETDPFFIDHPTWGPHYLNETSPCIDAGNPDSAYNDIENPENPGFTLPPSQNTTKNDMGCYGGPRPLFLELNNFSPIADAGLDQKVITGEIVYFDGSGSYHPGGYIVSYEWDFGDTTNGTGETITHQYTNEGNFTVTLTVTDNEGITDTDICIIQVFPSVVYVPQDFSTIQEAIDKAIDGIVISVAPGIYTENINFLGKAIIVRAANASNATIIDGCQNGSVVTFHQSEGLDSVLEGFIITNGSADFGGGIKCDGVSTDYVSPTIRNNLIIDNTAHVNGGGIYCIASLAEITNNIIINNTAETDGGGIYCRLVSGKIANNLITRNTATLNGGGLAFVRLSAPNIINNIITQNIALSGSGIYSADASHPIIAYCNVWNNIPFTENCYGCSLGVGCIAADPQFIYHTVYGSFYLNESSPCIDAGDPAEEYNDIEDPFSPGWALLPAQGTIRNDIGCYGGPMPLLMKIGITDFQPFANAGPDTGVLFGDLAYFDGSDSFDIDGYITQYDWDFGDSTNGTGETITHQYNTTGTYDVTLTVTDDKGMSDTDVCIVHVLNPLYVPDQYSTIQEAIDNAVVFQMIFVAPGTYEENINFLGKPITVKSTHGPNVTIIDGSQSGAVVTFNNDETTSSVLEGFTITNGSADKGGGIYCRFASPTIINNIVKCNDAEVDGGGIYCYHSSPLIVNNIIVHNTVEEYNGGGIYCNKASPLITNNIIIGNTAETDGGGIYCYENSPAIINNVIVENIAYRDGGGIYCRVNSPAIINNVIAENIAYRYGGGIRCYSSFSQIINNIITSNAADQGGGINCYGNSPSIIYCNIWDNAVNNYYGCSPGIGCIETEPQFIEQSTTWNGRYFLKKTSPCIDAGNPDVIFNDIEDQSNHGFALIPSQGTIRNDMGCYGGPTPILLPWENYPPFADAGPDQLVDFGEPVAFNASESYDIDGTIENYIWDFGDNTTGTGITTTHRYNHSEMYIVTLTVIDNNGITDTATCIVAPFFLFVPENYSTIQEAINHAIDGQTILVSPSTYPENIDFLGKTITVKSTDGPLVTCIDGGQNGPVVTFDKGETSDTVLDGFTIKGGNAERGGGIYCGKHYVGIHTTPMIINNTIIQNSASYKGGGIYCYSSSPTIIGNIITQNTADVYGGGICCDLYSSPIITNNFITSNTVYYGGGIYYNNPLVNINNNIITQNNASFGGGIYSSHSSSTIINNVLINNTALFGGGIACNYGCTPDIINNIIISNSVTFDGGGIHCWEDNPPVITYCNVWDNSPNNYDGCSPGTGCIETNPFFIDHPMWGPHYLDVLSPCIDAGNPSSEYDDVEDPMNPGYALPPGQNTTRNDMGCYGGPTPLIYYG
jgi:chitodextrinase